MMMNEAAVNVQVSSMNSSNLVKSQSDSINFMHRSMDSIPNDVKRRSSTADILTPILKTEFARFHSQIPINKSNSISSSSSHSIDENSTSSWNFTIPHTFFSKDNKQRGGVSWANDCAFSYCCNKECSVSFNFFHRRHHCRKCGLIFCDDCTKSTIMIPSLGFADPVRVCKRCYGTEIEQQKTERLLADLIEEPSLDSYNNSEVYIEVIAGGSN